jgi:N-acetylmuramoyl-L-alanine amidase
MEEKTGGAVSKNGVKESDINLKIALKVQNLLESNGINVILTRSDENAIYNGEEKTLRKKKISDMQNRVKIGNNSNADIFISIHLNKIPQEQYYGWQCFFNKKDENSIKLAKSIQKALNETIETENKREALNLQNIYIVKNIKIPIAIVECGFLSNQTEEQLLQTEEYQSKLAYGIFKGINDYF